MAALSRLLTVLLSLHVAASTLHSPASQGRLRYETAGELEWFSDQTVASLAAPLGSLAVRKEWRLRAAAMLAAVRTSEWSGEARGEARSVLDLGDPAAGRAVERVRAFSEPSPRASL